MTEEQFNESRDYVNGRLASEHLFEVPAQTFCEVFKPEASILSGALQASEDGWNAVCNRWGMEG
jgi:hypothetical protein